MMMKTLLRTSAGAAAVEFALILPILLPLLFGVLAYGYYAVVCIALKTAASEGARASVAGMTDSERASLAKAAVETFMHNSGGLLAWNANCTDCFSSGTVSTGYYQVTVTYHLGGWLALPFIPTPNLTPTSSVVAGYGGY